MKKILLDTNAYCQLFRRDERVLTILAHAHLVYLSVFVIAELYTGFKGGKKETENKIILEKFIKKPHVCILNTSIETADIFSDIKIKLKEKKTPIPLNDVWIASHCIETGSVLISFDKHFNNVPGLRIWDHL
jgi:tRNA(fMet)-specific endonuclease VapC